MTPLQLKIIYNACVIRLDRGEDLQDILNSYPKLSEEERQELILQLARDVND